MRKRREEKAITLIALIITIVVLLILAVVAINSVTGDGIIQHAVNAKTEYEEAQDEEQGMLSYYESYLEGNGKISTWDGESKEEPEIKDGNWYIYNCEQMKFFADFVNGKLTEEEKGTLSITEDTVVYLMTNLDLGARQENGVLITGTKWEPIGVDSTQSFVGTFDGNGYFVKGVYVKEEKNYSGLFGYSKNIIQNLSIKDSYIEVKGSAVGAIVGNGTIIQNCHNINTSVKQITGYCVGGIVGQVTEKIQNCTNTGKVFGNEEGYEGSSSAGGIAGGTTSNVKIEYCRNSGEITALGSRVGGIVGNSNSIGVEINNSVNTEIVNGRSYVGGIVGVCASYYGESSIILKNCYNMGTVKGQENIGGIIGAISGSGASIIGTYNTKEVNGTNNIGAIIGSNDKGSENTIEKCYYLEGISSTAIGNGVSDVTDEVCSMEEINMKNGTLLERLNTVDNSWTGSNGGYPKLKWE